jgi:anti-anti-sigma factor
MEAYTIERNGDECLVTVQGDLTAPIVPALQAALKKELEQGARKAVFDLAATDMLDSSGIGLLIAANNSLSSRMGGITVSHVSENILRLLQNMRLVSRLHVSGR